MPLANFFKRGSRKGTEKPNQNGVFPKTTPHQIQETEQHKSKIVEERTDRTELVEDKENNQESNEPATTSTENVFKPTMSEKLSSLFVSAEEKNNENCEHGESSKLEKQPISECLQPIKAKLVMNEKNDLEFNDATTTSSENTLKSIISESINTNISSHEIKSSKNCEHNGSSEPEGRPISKSLIPNDAKPSKSCDKGVEIITKETHTSQIISQANEQNDESGNELNSCCEKGNESSINNLSEEKDLTDELNLKEYESCLSKTKKGVKPIQKFLSEGGALSAENSSVTDVGAKSTHESQQLDKIHPVLINEEENPKNVIEQRTFVSCSYQMLPEKLVHNLISETSCTAESTPLNHIENSEGTNEMVKNIALEIPGISEFQLHNQTQENELIKSSITSNDDENSVKLLDEQKDLQNVAPEIPQVSKFQLHDQIQENELMKSSTTFDDSEIGIKIFDEEKDLQHGKCNQEQTTFVSCSYQMLPEKLIHNLISETSCTAESISLNHIENSEGINEMVKNIALEIPGITEFQLHNQTQENELIKSSITSNDDENSDELDEQKDLQSIAPKIQVTEFQLNDQIQENELMKSSTALDDSEVSIKILEEEKDLLHGKDNQEKKLETKINSTNSTISSKNGEEQGVLDVLKTLVQDVISLEQKQNNSESNQKMLELSPTKEIYQPLATEDYDAPMYSEFCEKLASEALQQALTEVNLITFEEDEVNDINIQEPLLDVEDEVKNLNTEKLLDVEDEPKIQTIVETPGSGDPYSILTDSEDLAEDIPSVPQQLETNSNPNWKVGYLEVKLPTKSRGKVKLKAWQKRWVVIQADEFTRDEKNCHLMLSIYHSESGNSRRHSALFWKSVSSKKAVVYRSMSKTHPYAFTIVYDKEILLHLAGSSETETQEWMSAIRNILWPPNPVMQLEKVLNGNEFDVSFIDNDFSYRAGLLGTYGCLSVTNRKLILTHPQMGHVIQEWYLNTVDKFQILLQPKEEDANKILIMHTSRDSSTGLGELRIYCNEAVSFLKSLASTIHKVLQYHCKGNNSEKYHKELEEISEWLTPQPSPIMNRTCEAEDYYKVPKRQVRSLLDIPNFIFDKPIGQTTLLCDPLAITSNRLSTEHPKLTPSLTSVSAFSQDSGISTATSSSDFLNCSQTSFSIGGSEIPRLGKYESSSCESLDTYTPPRSPVLDKNCRKEENIAKTENVM